MAIQPNAIMTAVLYTVGEDGVERKVLKELMQINGPTFLELHVNLRHFLGKVCGKSLSKPV